MMNKLKPTSVMLGLCSIFAMVGLGAFSTSTWATSGDPLQQFVKPKPITNKLKASPVFEGRGDGVVVCPVTGEKIKNKAYKANFHGREVLFCCKGCLQSAKHDPDRYIKPTMAEQQQAVKAFVAQVPQAPSGEEFCNE